MLFSNCLFEEIVVIVIWNINVVGVFVENLRNEFIFYVYKLFLESLEEFIMLKILYDDFL